ncbi:unnamed protein product [Camellia sinensis]
MNFFFLWISGVVPDCWKTCSFLQTERFVLLSSLGICNPSHHSEGSYFIVFSSNLNISLDTVLRLEDMEMVSQLTILQGSINGFQRVKEREMA